MHLVKNAKNTQTQYKFKTFYLLYVKHSFI